MWKAGFPWSFASSARRRVLALFRPPTMKTASVPAASALISVWRFSVESQIVSKTTASGEPLPDAADDGRVLLQALRRLGDDAYLREVGEAGHIIGAIR